MTGPYYRTVRHYLQEMFGTRVYKVTLDAGFTCPNVDGSKGRGGCTFCDDTGSSSRAQNPRDPIGEQIRQNIERQRARFGAEKFIAYFQSRTNTYGPLARLKRLYDEALAAHPDVVGLAISTRPDCVDADTLDLIASYRQAGRYVAVEYGMQTIHDATLARINRCETHADFLRAYALTRARGLDHTIHVVLGLPGESHADMMASADALADLDVQGVKIHLLVAMAGTALAADYAQGRWQPMSREAYIETVCDFIERLPPGCVIHRVAGNGHHAHVVAPRWMMHKFEVMNAIDAEFARRGSRQGQPCAAVSASVPGA